MNHFRVGVFAAIVDVIACDFFVLAFGYIFFNVCRYQRWQAVVKIEIFSFGAKAV